MRVILKEDVKNLGQMGVIVNVTDGYARNYLIPKKLAIEANTKNIREMEHIKKGILIRAERIKESFNNVAEKMSSTTLTIKAKAGEDDKLFGSITNMNIAEALKGEGFDVDKKKIIIDEPIRRLGTYSVNIKLHPEIISQVKVLVISDIPDSPK